MPRPKSYNFRTGQIRTMITKNDAGRVTAQVWDPRRYAYGEATPDPVHGLPISAIRALRAAIEDNPVFSPAEQAAIATNLADAIGLPIEVVPGD
jgi:hypothetical protein